MDTTKHLDELHKENTAWKQKLYFVRDEIKTYNNRLAEVVSSHRETETLAKAEHFQNQFIRHNEVIDHLVYDINAEEHKLVLIAKQNNVASDFKAVKENLELVNRMKMFNKIYDELKAEYLEYLYKVY